MRICFGLKTGLHIFFLFLCAGAACAAPPVLPEDRSAAVILAYHRVGEDAYPDTNIRLDQFRAHIEELQHGGYEVLPLPDIIAALKAGKALPDNAVAITFEGAYHSAYEQAMPLLLERDIPFTVFFASDHADSSTGQYMNWDGLKFLQRQSGVTLGILPASYIRLAGEPRAEILAEINKAQARYRKMLGNSPRLFSYPFGEYSSAYRNLIKAQGFEAALGLHSGAVYSGADIWALPRFTMTEPYGDIERFKMVSRALPLPADDIEPQDPYLDRPDPAIGFTLGEALAGQREMLSCFISEQGLPGIEFLGQGRVELRPLEPFSGGRIRVNCTMPGPSGADGAPRWRWLGLLLVSAGEE